MGIIGSFFNSIYSYMSCSNQPEPERRTIIMDMDSSQNNRSSYYVVTNDELPRANYR